MSSPSHLVNAAMILARAAHAGQFDKRGQDYFEHHLTPVAEALRPFGPLAVAAGYLHDILEDTEMQPDQLLLIFGPAVTGAVLAVTRRPGESYADAIGRAAQHPLGRLVKLADNHVNMSTLDALAETLPATAARLRRRYEKAREVLEHHLEVSCG